MDQADSPRSTTLLTTPRRYTRLEPLSPGLKSEQTVEFSLSETHGDVSPSPSDHGSMRIQQSGVSYVGSSHWAGILDSIADLRSHLAHLRLVDYSQASIIVPKPHLLYNSPIDQFLRESGLPRLVKESQTDTAEPGNLEDSDFDEDTAELPASRPETEITPILYVLGKLRLLSVGVRVTDVATEPRPHSYAQVLKLDYDINEARSALPSSLKWTGLTSSLSVPSKIIIQRIWLEVTIHQLKIVLHRKFLEPSRLQQQYDTSRSVCLNAAIKILEFQHLVDEETRTDGLFYQNHWRISSAFTNDFLLATSVLCIFLQNHIGQQKEPVEDAEDLKVMPVDGIKVKKLLKTSQAIWSRECATSREARKAVAALRYVLGEEDCQTEAHVSEYMMPAPVPAMDASSSAGFDDSLHDYDSPSHSLEPVFDGTTWPATFTDSFGMISDHWAGIAGLEDMDLTY
ncbi:hypothetical protein N0V82_003919 [Gnomoniopsis sp. IMI 355080]|nr:hypothetical protein N0V82_003919 [Gnomoniopsis sp. IMI 355080]